MKQWEKDEARTRPFLPSIFYIIGKHLNCAVSVLEASAMLDRKEATDATIQCSRGHVGIRTRFLDDPRYRSLFDWTIRSFRRSGSETELSKMRKGHCDVYFYCWIWDDKIQRWEIVDVKKVRELGLLEWSWPFTLNKRDGGETGFIALDFEMLDFKGCCIARSHPHLWTERERAKKALEEQKLQLIAC